MKEGNTGLTGALEAVLFAMGEPVARSLLAKALETDEDTVEKAAAELSEIYNREERGIHLISLDESYQLGTKPCYYSNLITIASMPEKPVLSETVLETLAIIAYRQPVTKAEISKIRGVSSDHAVSKLVEYGLIKEAGRLNAPGRPMLFVTTKEFLRRFGMESLGQLPETKPYKKKENTQDSEMEAEEIMDSEKNNTMDSESENTELEE
ncbi:MAG: SMC-Scp complex subunit ScpB [Lachnospiraceae bacterium]|nr:SMC-Scp complex subunit ScpB [Lachnospiraceae bacterium]